MKKKRLSVLPFALLLVFGSAMADDGVWVERNDGTNQGFLFSEIPRVTYSDDNLVMTTSKATATFPLAEVRRVYFDNVDNTTGIGSQQTADDQHPLIKVQTEGVELSDFSLDTVVDIFDAAGQLLARQKISADGTLSVSLSAQKRGIYIIKTEKTTLKIQKK